MDTKFTTIVTVIYSCYYLLIAVIITNFESYISYIILYIGLMNKFSLFLIISPRRFEKKETIIFSFL